MRAKLARVWCYKSLFIDVSSKYVYMMASVSESRFYFDAKICEKTIHF